MLRSGGGGGAAVLPECGGVDGQRTQTHEAQGLGKDAFRCDFIAGLLHIHTAMKEKSKKKKVEVEDEMRILQQSLENER